MSQSRQLAAIMFTDIVGYTALMGDDEQRAFELLNKNRLLQKPLIEQYNGKWIKELGDGVLATFSTVTDAVNCARSIIKGCEQVQGLKLRIGIHQAEVIFENDDVFGDGVNIASRLQALASIGGICISETVRNNVANRKEIKIRFIKEETLKHVKEPVRIYEVVMENNQPEEEVSSNHTTVKTTPGKSIAALPFVNMSNDPEQEYFSDGITEEIINLLAQIKELKVISRTSSFSFKGKNVDVRKIAETLSVGNILEGSVRKSGNTIRITAQLIEARDGTHLWSGTYDRKIEDIFKVQDEISTAVVQQLKIKLLSANKTAVMENSVAYNFYLKGRYEWGKRTREGFLKSIDYFNQAILEDPQYSLAYAGMADSYTLLCGYHILSPQASISKAKSAAEKAMQLNPTLAEAYEATGHIEFLADVNWQKSEENYKQAIQLNPGFATARQRYALMLATQGRFAEAIEEIKKAQELDPLSKIINTDVGLVHLLMGNADRAIDKCKEVLEIDPVFSVALFVQGLAYELNGKTESAVTNFRQAVHASNNNPITKSALGHALAISGDKSEALKILKELQFSSDQQYVSPYCIAAIYAGLGEPDKVFKWLNKAVDDKSVWMIHLHFSADTRFKEFKTDNRYEELLQRIKMVRE